jgi:DNA-binding transcriptional LysR family regulator
MEMGSPEAMRRLVEVGLGVSVLPAALVAEALAAGRLVRLLLPGFRPTRPLGFAVAEGRPIAPAADAFRRLVREHVGRASRTEPWRNARSKSPSPRPPSR